MLLKLEADHRLLAIAEGRLRANGLSGWVLRRQAREQSRERARAQLSDFNELNPSVARTAAYTWHGSAAQPG